MQPALGLRKPAPPPGSLVLPQHHGPRARPATNARITLIMKWVIGDIVLGNEAPNLLLRPVRQRTHLHQTAFLVPADNRRFGTIRTLVPTDRAGPRVHAHHRLFQHLYLSVIA